MRRIVPKDDVLEVRDTRDLLDRIMDKGIVLDPANRLEISSAEHLGQDQVVVGMIDTQLQKRAA